MHFSLSAYRRWVLLFETLFLINFQSFAQNNDSATDNTARKANPIELNYTYSVELSAQALAKILPYFDLRKIPTNFHSTEFPETIGQDYVSN